MRVCSYDLDVYDPWRLPFLPADNHISLRFPRPDQPLGGPRVTTNNTLSTQGAPNGSPNGGVPFSNTQQDTIMIQDPDADKDSGGPGLLSL